MVNPPQLPRSAVPPTAMGMTGQDPGEKVVLGQVPLWGSGRDGFDKAAGTVGPKRH